MSVDWNTLVIGPTVTVFGDPVAYTKPGGVSFQIIGVFDQEYLDNNALGAGSLEQMGVPGNITSTRPVVGVQLSQFPAGSSPAQGDSLTFVPTGASFVVMEVRADGHGWAKLLLNNAA
jgi:hypothetical protein